MRSARRKTTNEIPPERRTGTHRRAALEAHARPPLVLLVDDAEDNRALYAMYFGHLELRVEHAVDGEHALLKIMQLLPDVVVMDLSMPVLDGWEAIRQMKANPKMSEIPVIALTGNVTEEGLRRAHEAGADAVLTKPCAPPVLHGVVREFLSLRHD